jgi:PPM family protein phosphatase
MRIADSAGRTDAGRKRRRNEDSFVHDPPLFAVADGMGGAQAGEVASRLAAAAFREFHDADELDPEQRVAAIIQEANRRIYERAKSDAQASGMGTTITAALVTEDGVAVGHVGDSRGYRLRDGQLEQLTEDHSLVAELVRSGDLTRDQAAEHPQKNLITRALGANEEVEVDTMVLPVQASDRLLLCSDGLSDMIPETRIAEILADSPDDPETPARSLVSAALDAGGSDNVTVVVVDVKKVTPREEEKRSADTREMPAVSHSGERAAPTRPPEQQPSTKERRVSRPPKAAARRKKGGFGRLVRRLAAVLVVVVALTPAYLWGSTRYFLGLDNGEVVAYQGLPYAPLGVELNQEWRRTDVEASEVKSPYRGPIEDHKLYTREEIEPVLQDLGK